MEYAQVESGSFAIRVGLESVPEPEVNRSMVRVSRVEVRCSGAVWTDCWLRGDMYINRKKAADLLSEGSRMCPVAQIDETFRGGGDDWSGFQPTAVAVPHNTDGSSPMVELIVSIYIYSAGHGNIARVSGTVQVPIPAIGSVAEITALPVTLGQPMTVRLTEPDYGYRNTLRWDCGGEGAVLLELSDVTQTEWTPPVALAAQELHRDTVDITLNVTTYHTSGQYIGEKSLILTCPMPESVRPSLSVTVDDEMNYVTLYGAAVQDQSRLRVQTRTEESYGAPIRKIAVTLGKLSAKGADVRFLPSDSGSQELTVTVTDSRGRSAVFTQTVTVVPYRLPEVWITRVYRCDSLGNPQPDGNAVRVVFGGSVTELGGKNHAAYRLRRRVRGSVEWTVTVLEAWNGQCRVEDAVWAGTADIDRDYEFAVAVTDDFAAAVSSICVLPVAFALLDFDRSRRAVGIGQRASAERTLSVGLDMKLHGHGISDLSDPTDGGDAVTFRFLQGLYPVGCVYSAVTDTCAPAGIIGGKWEKIGFDSALAVYRWKRTE